MCLTVRYCAPQNGYTPLHQAATHGHAAVVEQLLAAGAVTGAKCKVRRVGYADRAGSRGDTRRVVESLLLVFVGFRSRLCCKFRFLCLVKGRIW